MADVRDRARELKEKLDRSRQPGTAGEESKVTRLMAPGVDVGDLAPRLASFYESKKLETQVFAGPPAWSVQARSPGWRKAIGMSTAITVVLRPDGDELCVEIGRAKWGDKALAGAAGMLVLWPLVITAAAGAFREGQLPRETVRFLTACIAESPGRGKLPGDESPAPPAPEMPHTPPRFEREGPVVDINRASAEQLATLPGIGRLDASKIVAERERLGGFADLNALAQATRLRPHVIAHLEDRVVFGAVAPSSGKPGRRIGDL
jgi:hypothetical protein